MKLTVLTEQITADIARGEYGLSGEQLPGIRELAERYDVSVQSAQNAIKILAERGLITLHGKRYYLSNGYASPSSPYGRILKSLAQPIIGLELNNIGNQYFSSITERLTAKARSEGYSLLTTSSNGSNSAKIENLRLFHKLNVSGIFAVPDINSVNAEIYRSCAVPLVILGREIALPNCDTVIVENELAGSKVARHLARMGCMSFAYIGLKDFLDSDNRLGGFAKQLTAMGLKLSDLLKVESAADETLRGQVMSVVRRSPKPLGIFCYHDLLAAEVLRTVKMSGRGQYKIPDDIAIAGFDDLPITTMVTPTLTTVSYQYDKIVDSAMSMMLDYISNPEHKVSSVAVPSALTIRQSTMRVQI